MITIKRIFFLTLFGASTLLSAAEHDGGAAGRLISGGDAAVGAKAINHLGSTLLQEMTSNPACRGANMGISPYNVTQVLAPLLMGSSGQARKELLALFGHETAMMADDEAERLTIQLVAGLVAMNKKVDEAGTLKQNNMILGDIGFKFKREFVERARANMKTAFGSMAFSHPDTVAFVNKWFSDKTNKLIPHMVDRLPVDGMGIFSATHFKDGWAEKFDKKETRDSRFNLDTESYVNVPTMYKKFGKDAHYWEGQSELIAELPYKGDGWKAHIVVPYEVQGKAIPLADYLNKLPSSNLTSLVSGAPSGSSPSVTLPRFELQSESGNCLKAVLGKHLPRAFAASQDFSGISSGNLKITDVAFKQVVKVDEDGTEAAAASHVGMAKSIGGPPPVKANKPFLFMVSGPEGAQMFIQRVDNPDPKAQKKSLKE